MMLNQKSPKNDKTQPIVSEEDFKNSDNYKRAFTMAKEIEKIFGDREAKGKKTHESYSRQVIKDMIQKLEEYKGKHGNYKKILLDNMSREDQEKLKGLKDIPVYMLEQILENEMDEQEDPK